MAGSIIKKYRYCHGQLRPVSSKKSHPRTGKKSHPRIDFGHRNYSRYINRVLKEVVPQRGISSGTMDVINTLINDILESIATEARHLMYFRNRCTLTPEDIQKAVCLMLPRKLSRPAVTFGSEAVHRYVHS